MISNAARNGVSSTNWMVGSECLVVRATSPSGCLYIYSFPISPVSSYMPTCSNTFPVRLSVIVKEPFVVIVTCMCLFSISLPDAIIVDVFRSVSSCLETRAKVLYPRAGTSSASKVTLMRRTIYGWRNLSSGKSYEKVIPDHPWKNHKLYHLHQQADFERYKTTSGLLCLRHQQSILA